MQVYGLPTIQQIAEGNDFSLALDSSGDVWAWGDNYNGELGNATPNSSYTPTQVAGLSNIIQVAAGYDTSYALKAGGTVYAWGNNAFGELGTNTTLSNASTPVQISGLSNVTAISTNEGRDHLVARKSDGTVWSLGLNSSGELGNGSSVSQSAIPEEASTLSNTVGVSGGGDFTLALLSDNTIRAWGNNTDGQVGTAYSSVPIVVPMPFDAHLQSLDIDIPGLTFNPDTTSYTLTTLPETGWVNITATADDPNATVTLDGDPFQNGQGLQQMLNVGPNQCTLNVTSSDQSTTMTYTLNIFVPEPPVQFITSSLHSVAAGGQMAVSGVVYDVYNNPVANSSVALTSNDGTWTDSGTSSSSVITNVNGIFTDTWKAPNTTGQYTLMAQGNGSGATVTVSVYSAPTSSTGSTGGSTTGTSSSGSTSGSTGGSTSSLSSSTSNSTGSNSGTGGNSGSSTSGSTPASSGTGLPPGGSFNCRES